MKISNQIRKVPKLVVVGLLIAGVGYGAFYVKQALAATTVPRLASFDPSVWYPSVPVASEGQYDKYVYVDLSFHPYANHSPSYYDSDALDGDSEIEKQPYFEVVITKNGSEFFRCRNDWPIYDTCGGNSVYDNSPARGTSHTYSAYVQQYKRYAGCSGSGDTDCGKTGTLTGTSPSITKTVYIGTENPPRMRSNLSYNNKLASSQLLVLKGGEVSFSWSRGDQAGMQYAGDPAQYCVLTHTVNGERITLDTNAKESGSRVIPVGETLGQQSIGVACYNGAGEDHPGSTSRSFEVVEAIPDGYYDDAELAGGGGAGIAVPVEPVENEAGDLDGNGQTDSEQTNLKNVYSSASGTYVALGVNKCSVTSSGFTASPVIADSPQEEASYQYPFGVMAFTLGCQTPGETVTVTKHYYTSANANNATLRKFSLVDGSTRPIPEAVLENVTLGGRQAIKVTYPITDGGAYDEDGQVNGVIVDPVALGTIEEERAEIETDCVEESLNADNCGIISYIVVSINILTGIVGIIVVIMIVVGGIQYSSAAGDPNGVAAAKKKIYNALLALVAYLFVYSFLQWLVPGGVF